MSAIWNEKREPICKVLPRLLSLSISLLDLGGHSLMMKETRKDKIRKDWVYIMLFVTIDVYRLIKAYRAVSGSMCKSQQFSISQFLKKNFEMVGNDSSRRAVWFCLFGTDERHTSHVYRKWKTELNSECWLVFYHPSRAVKATFG
jgi:hypothetical protein